MRKLVFGFFEKAKLKLACSASLEILDLASVGILLVNNKGADQTARMCRLIFLSINTALSHV